MTSQYLPDAHMAGLLVILVWADSGDSLVPRTENYHTEQNLWCWDKLSEQDKLSHCCDCSHASGSDKVNEEREEKQSGRELSKALW